MRRAWGGPGSSNTTGSPMNCGCTADRTRHPQLSEAHLASSCVPGGSIDARSARYPAEVVPCRTHGLCLEALTFKKSCSQGGLQHCAEVLKQKTPSVTLTNTSIQTPFLTGHTECWNQRSPGPGPSGESRDRIRCIGNGSAALTP